MPQISMVPTPRSMRSIFVGALSVALMALVVGCGGGNDKTKSPASSGGGGKTTAAKSPASTPSSKTTGKKTESSSTPKTAEKGVGTLKGVIKFDGDFTALPAVITKGDGNVKDAEVCAANDVADESLVVSADKGIANVFIYLRRAPKGAKTEAPSEPVVLDQKTCTFVPHAMTIQVGQKLLLKSSDAAPHNVHTEPVKNNSENIVVQPNDQSGLPITYSLAESEPFIVKCDFHSWMKCYQLVLDHPFMAVSSETGDFEIPNLPAGKHKFRVWHEKGGVLERDYEVEIKANETTTVELSFGGDKFAGVGPKDVKSISLSMIK